MHRTARALLAFVLAASASVAAAQTAAPNPGNRVNADPVGEPTGIGDWGTLGRMVEPVWVTQGVPLQRTTVSNWLVPGKVLILRHGTTERMRLGAKFADIVQRVELNPSTGKFDITYTYEDGRKLSAVGQVEPDGVFSDLLTAADGSRQRNLYPLDTPRKMRIVRQKHLGAGWTTTSTVVKIGETPAERASREEADRKIAAAEAARKVAEEARRRAEEEARWAEEEAEREADEMESQAQQQRNWQNFQNDLQGIVQKQRDDIEDSRRFEERIRVTVERAEEERRRRQEEADRAAAEAQQLRQQQVDVALRGHQPQQQIPQQNAQRLQAERAEAERQRLAAERQRQARQQQQAGEQQNAQAEQARQEQAKREAEAKARAENPMVLWKEGVVLCEPPKSGSGDWACHGPLQTTYGMPGKPSGNIAVRQACGGDGAGVRELGQAGGFHTYGCGFGINPNQPSGHDPADRYGIFVPGRTTFTCPKKQSTVCRSRN
jgi:hypothetical protein